MNAKDTLVEMLEVNNLEYVLHNTKFGFTIELTNYYQFDFDFDGHNI